MNEQLKYLIDVIQNLHVAKYNMYELITNLSSRVSVKILNLLGSQTVSIICNSYLN